MRTILLAGILCATFIARAEDKPRDAAEKAVAELTKALDVTPKSAELLSRRGGEYFKLGKFKESIADFDKQIELDPKSAEDHWRRGISLYYAGRFEDGAKQFELGKKVYGNDVENAFWHYLCLARQDKVATARAKLLPIGTDSRYYMPKVYELIAGKATSEDLLAVVEKSSVKDKREGYFYTHLYIGLNYEAEGDAKKALEHIKLAHEKYAVDHYMADVARVHAELPVKRK
ncbi:tetratricopeptide repeat protein [soil metagenome]